MALSCGLIGIASSGKTITFKAITSSRILSANPSDMNRMIIKVPDSRLEKLAAMYEPNKVVPTTIEVVDIPGLSTRGPSDGKGFRLLGHIKNVDALIHVVRCFEDPNIPFEYETIDPKRDVETVDLELMMADNATLENKIARLSKKLKTGDKEAAKDSAACEKVLNAIKQGIPARRQNLTPAEMASVYDCNLVSLKPVVYVANIKNPEDAANKHVKALEELAAGEPTEIVVLRGKDEADIADLEPEEREIFLKELGLEQSSMERLVYAAYRKLELITFFTVGKDEVRAWTCRRGDKAPAAAGKIHTDLEKGFIRMETISYDDLISLGSEAAVAKAGKKRVESREYVVQDGDIVQVLFNKP